MVVYRDYKKKLWGRVLRERVIRKTQRLPHFRDVELVEVPSRRVPNWSMGIASQTEAGIIFRGMPYSSVNQKDDLFILKRDIEYSWTPFWFEDP